MKVLTTNFLTCAVKTCKTSPASYPLHFRDASLERTEIDFNPLFLRNILPRVNWDALKTTASELGLGALVPEQNPGEVGDDNDDEGKENHEVVMVEADDDGHVGQSTSVQGEEGQKGASSSEDVLKRLHQLLLETAVVEGKLVCSNCGFEYPIKEGVGNFLLPAHLV